MNRSTLEEISTFTGDVQRAEAKIAHCEQVVEELRPSSTSDRGGTADHGWPDSRLRTLDAELTELMEPVHRTTTRDGSLVKPAPGRDRPPWLDRVAEVAQPPTPDHDADHGIDLGL